MEPPKSKFYRKLIIAVCLLGIVIFVAFRSYISLHFGIVSTDPTVGQMTIWDTDFKVNFSKTLALKGLSVSVQPNDAIYKNKIQVSGKTLTIELNSPLNSHSTYTFTINSIAATSGQTITNKQFVFTPKSVPRSQIKEDDQEALIQRNQKSNVYSDPILSHLPYSNLDFSLTSSFPINGSNNTPELVLEAQLLLAPGVSGEEATTDTNQYKQEVLNYINSLGLNPANYNIRYQVVNESLNGP